MTAPAIRYVPEPFTHLYYSPVYPTLSPRQQLVYNRLHACYMCELIVLFEQTLPAFYLKAAAGRRVSAELRRRVLELAASEARHAAMFRDLAKGLAPELYRSFAFRFVQAPAALPGLRALLETPALLPVILWIGLLQEERGLFYGREIVSQAAGLDPRVVDAHRRHIEDEREHLGVDEALLGLYWEEAPAWLRRLDGRLFRFVVAEFLNAPKRGGLRVVRRLAAERPELAPREAELLAAMRGLARDPRFHESSYSRSMVPRTFALFDRCAEFRDLGKELWGYVAS